MLKKLLRLSSWLVISQFVVKIIAFGYTLFLARTLGVDEFGVYTFALAIFLLLNAVSDLGISRYLVKEMSKGSGVRRELVANVVMLRAAILSLMVLIAAVFISLYDTQTMRTIVTIMALATLVPQAITLSLENILVAKQRFNWSAIASIVSSLLTVGIGAILVLQGYQAFGAVLALFLSQLIYCGGWLVVVRNQWSNQDLKQVSRGQMKLILKGSLPYGLLAVMGLVYFRIDTVLLTYLRGSYETGLYALGYKFLEGVVFIPSSLAVVVFPALVLLHQGKMVDVRKFATKLIIVMGGFGLLVMLGFIFGLPVLIDNFLPAYRPAIGTVQILALAIPAMFIHVPLSQVLLSSDKYLRHILVLSLLPVSLNIGLNLIFIPTYGYIAAAWVTVFSDILSLGLLLLVMRKTIYAVEVNK